LPRRRDIEAAVAAHNRNTDQRTLLPPEAVRLLAVMFRQSSVCQRSQDDLAAEGFNLRPLLRALIAARFLSRAPGPGRGASTVYRLHLPPRSQP
jgi:hypothetical protein